MRESTKIKHEFFNALKCGTGRAFVILKDNPNIDFSKLILKGAATNFANDPQSEGSRAWYIYNLIKKSKQKEFIIASVLKKLEKEGEDYRGINQMCDLAVYFHKDGVPNAKEAIYKQAKIDAENDIDFCGKDQILEVDGLEGAIKVAEIVGKILFENEDEYEDSWRIEYFQKRNKSIDVCHEIEKAAKNNKYIATYFKYVCNQKKVRKRYKKIKRFNYELVKERIDLGQLIGFSIERANELSKEEVERLANDFLTEKKNLQREQYLRFFTNRKFPFDFQSILKIASGKDVRSKEYPKIRIVEFACKSLRFFKNPNIRKLGLEKIASKKNPYRYLNLLIGNYEKGDYKILNEVISRSNNYDYIHSLVYGLIDIYKVNQVKECQEPLETMYQKMNCGIHRIDILRILEYNGVLSDKIFREMKYDSEERVRKMYRVLRKKRALQKGGLPKG